MTDLVERLRDLHRRFGHLVDLGISNGWNEAATAIEAKDKELAALRERVKCKDVEISGAVERSRMLLDAKDYWKARAETAERELTREREAFQRHEQTLRDNGINSHSEAVVLVTTLRRERDEAREAWKRLLLELGKSP